MFLDEVAEETETLEGPSGQEAITNATETVQKRTPEEIALQMEYINQMELIFEEMRGSHATFLDTIKNRWTFLSDRSNSVQFIAMQWIYVKVITMRHNAIDEKTIETLFRDVLENTFDNGFEIYDTFESIVNEKAECLFQPLPACPMHEIAN